MNQTSKKFAAFMLVFIGANFANVRAQDPSAPPEVMRLRGTIISLLDGNMVLKERSGKTLQIAVTDSLSVQEVYPFGFGKIETGAVIGSTGLERADGSFSAIEVRMFPIERGGPPEGQRESDLQEDSILTNGHVLNVDSEKMELTLRVKDQDIVIHVAANTLVVTYRPGDPGLLRPGAKVYLHATQEGPDCYRASSATVGADGMTPPQ